MSRPTSRPKSDVSLAITRLRESLGETQHEFARRLRLTPVSVARYETSREPRGAILERLYRLGAKHHPPSAKVFRRALDDEKEQQYLRRRMGEILDPLNVKAASQTLMEIRETQERLRQAILGTPSIDGVDQFILIAFDDVEEQIRKMADLLLIGGRKEYLGEE
jgi:transcriptional regulator with XRE-family HTH domain